MSRAFMFVLAALSGLAAAAWAAKPSPPRRTPSRTEAPPADVGLLDFSAQPFSDQGSHFALLHRKEGGLCDFEFRSAYAFGSLAAEDHPSKRLFRFRVELEVEGGPARFGEGIRAAARYGPRWIEVEAEDGGIQAQAGLAFPETDAISGAVNFSNRTREVLKLRPVLALEGGGEGFETAAAFENKDGVLTLELDRSRWAQRHLKEVICLAAGAGPAGPGARSAGSAAAFGAPGALEALSARRTRDGRFSLRLGPKAFTTLKPGQVLRFPFCFNLGLSIEEARRPMARLWRRWTLPRGQALSKAKARWNLSAARAPRPADPRWERPARAAFACLLMSSYARRGELKADMFSQAKGFRDAFFSEGLPMIALGWSEIDYGAAEAALLELMSYSAAAALPIPPHTGEERLRWEAGGWSLCGLAAWELFQRDPEVASNRPQTFMAALGGRLRAECAWWPPNRDGDGNGLYAFSNQEEKPWYQRLSPVAADELPTFNLALSALLAWQMQAASALAQSAGEDAEARTLLEQSRKTIEALKARARGQDGRYEQGYDGYWPYLLALDTESRAALEALAREALDGQGPPFVEHQIFHPWRVYFWIRCLSLWGYAQAAARAAERALEFLAGKPHFTAYTPDGRGLGAPGDAATAAALLELAMQRHEQEALLLPDTMGLEGRLLQVRTPDGSFYFKRVALPLDKSPYARLSFSSPSGRPILEAGEFDVQAETLVAVSLSSRRSLSIQDPTGKEIFKHAQSAQLFLKPNLRYRVRFENN